MKPAQLTYAFALLLLSIILAAVAGCDLGDIVRVKTPIAIQQQVGLPAAVSLNEAEAEYRAWIQSAQRTGAQWKTSIERGNEVRGLLGQLTLSVLDSFGPTLAGVPVLGPSLPALTGLVGLFLGAARLRREKEASFNKGLRTAGELPPPAPPATPPTEISA